MKVQTRLTSTAKAILQRGKTSSAVNSEMNAFQTPFPQILEEVSFWFRSGVKWLSRGSRAVRAWAVLSPRWWHQPVPKASCWCAAASSWAHSEEERALPEMCARPRGGSLRSLWLCPRAQALLQPCPCLATLPDPTGTWISSAEL